MIEKRINYRFGGGYQGRDSSPVDRGGDRQESGGGGGRQEYSAQQYTAPKPTPTPSTSKPSKMSYSSQFLIFWKDVKNKVSKGIAEKNYLKLEKEWIAKPKELATIYNKYYDSIDDKQFAKQPA